ncbi:MAG: FG-GAP-like repeat-containing protein, partial [Chloroflexi bacterium]|nr:FG-GAP-like repeat-containing protein [Chloroflexota bacterium]
MSWGDFNNDGRLDLATLMSGGQVDVYPNNGNGAFDAPISIEVINNRNSGSDMAWADVDGDGDLDLSVAHNGRSNMIHLNNGNGTFGAVIPFGRSMGTVQNFTASMAWADIDGDGDLDVAIGSGYSTIQSVIYLNAPDPSLSALTLSTGKLMPVVDPTTWAYAARVPYATSSVAVTATTADVSATLSYGACTGGVCALQPGANVFTLTTTARDGVTTQDYVLTIERGLLAAYSPAANAFNAPLTAGVALTYRVPLNASTVTSATVRMHGMQSGKVIAAPVVAGNKVIVAPAKPFFPGELVWTTVTSAATDVTGTRNLPTVWQFNAAPSAGWGSFASTSRSFGPANGDPYYHNSMAWGDFNGDGHLDLALGSEQGQSAVYLNDGFGAFNVSVTIGSPGIYNWALAPGDFNGDGRLDLVVGSDGYDLNYIYLSDGAGGFAPGVSINDDDYLDTTSIATGDFNGDGHLDLVLGSDYGCSYVYLNNGGGTFAPGTCFGTGSDDIESLAAGDFNGDGALDLAAGRRTGQSMVYPGYGDGFFGAGIPFGGITNTVFGLAWGDFNGDGRLDLAVANDQAQSMVYPNAGNGFFGAGIPFGGATDPT